MIVCVTQRRGIRYFTRFADIAERDKLEVELRIELEDKPAKTVKFDLTEALLDAYSQHPELGKVSPVSIAEATAAQKTKPVIIKQSVSVSPAYLTESKQQKEELIARVREAQYKAAEERKQRNAEKGNRLAAARKAKAIAREEAEKAAAKAASKKKTTSAKAKSDTKEENPAKLTKTQKDAIKKIGQSLAKSEAKNRTKAKAEPAVVKPKASKAAPEKVSAKKTVKTEVVAKKDTTLKKTAKAEAVVKKDTAAKKTAATKTVASKPAAPKPKAAEVPATKTRSRASVGTTAVREKVAAKASK